MYVKLDEVLTEPFRTTIGCKQGCNISSILFNLFIERLPTVFDSQCHGVLLDDKLPVLTVYSSVNLERDYRGQC